MLHHERGETAEAEEQFRQILKTNPNQDKTSWLIPDSGLILLESAWIRTISEIGQVT
jgi:hypothetical protein